MTGYLVHSTVALEWNGKIQCRNSCRGISFLLCLVWERHSTPLFSNAPLLASNNFWTKVQLSTKSDVFFLAIILLSLLIFFNLLYGISKTALQRYSLVSYKKLYGWKFGHWL